jgi:hypothetical protein
MLREARNVIPAAQINDPLSALAFRVMAGLVPAIRRGTVLVVMAGTDPRNKSGEAMTRVGNE